MTVIVCGTQFQELCDKAIDQRLIFDLDEDLGDLVIGNFLSRMVHMFWEGRWE